MNQMLTQDWWPKPETCSLGCWLNQPLTQPWLRECHAHSSNMHQRLTQLKSETASFPHASATDSINIRDCKFLAPATNLASASDSSTSETASLQHPAAASSTVASNLLRATKKLSYGSSLSWGWRNNIVGLAKQYRGVGDGYRRAQQYLVNHRGAGDRSNGILNTV